jgi:hypothetical protein
MPSSAETQEQRRRQVIEDRVAVAIAHIFVRHPELTGFFLQDPAGFENVLNPPAKQLSVLDVSLSMPLGDKSHENIKQSIADTVTRVISERPEAFGMLRDRAFARMFH